MRLKIITPNRIAVDEHVQLDQPRVLVAEPVVVERAVAAAHALDTIVDQRGNSRAMW